MIVGGKPPLVKVNCARPFASTTYVPPAVAVVAVPPLFWRYESVKFPLFAERDPISTFGDPPAGLPCTAATLLPLSELKPNPPVGGTCNWAIPLYTTFWVVFMLMNMNSLGETIYTTSEMVPLTFVTVTLAERRPLETVSLVSA
jgi:hypothetical protein